MAQYRIGNILLFWICGRGKLRFYGPTHTDILSGSGTFFKKRLRNHNEFPIQYLNCGFRPFLRCERSPARTGVVSCTPWSCA